MPPATTFAGGRPADGQQLQWPMDELRYHGLRGNVWVSSALRMGEARKLPAGFTAEGKFLLQIVSWNEQGSLETQNVNNAADRASAGQRSVCRSGYLNRRVLVLDADTGAFKQCGAPTAAPMITRHRCSWAGLARSSSTPCMASGVERRSRLRERSTEQPHPDLHRRWEVPERIFIERRFRLLGTSFSTAFSPTGAALALRRRRGSNRVHIFDRRA